MAVRRHQLHDTIHVAGIVPPVVLQYHLFPLQSSGCPHLQVSRALTALSSMLRTASTQLLTFCARHDIGKAIRCRR